MNEINMDYKQLLKEAIQKIINKPNSYDKKGVKKFIKDGTIEMLNNYIVLLEQNKNKSTALQIEEFTKPFIQENCDQ